MASEAAKDAGVPPETKIDFFRAAFKIGFFSLLAGAAGVIITAYLKKSMTAGFAAGYIIGFANVIWLVRIVDKGTGLAAEKVVQFVLSRYYLRFAATVLIVVVLTVKEVFSAGSLMTGFASSFLITVIAMIFALRKEVFINA